MEELSDNTTPITSSDNSSDYFTDSSHCSSCHGSKRNIEE